MAQVLRINGCTESQPTAFVVSRLFSASKTFDLFSLILLSWESGVSTMASAKKQKAEFSQTEREELEKAFDAGMDSVSKEKLHLIQELSQKLQRNEHEIKVSIQALWHELGHTNLNFCFT